MYGQLLELMGTFAVDAVKLYLPVLASAGFSAAIGLGRWKDGILKTGTIKLARGEPSALKEI